MDMDYNLYYLKAKNKYTVHFLNKQKLSVDEIRDIFSKYGTVLGVTTSGNETGMRFVSYATLRETLACIQGIRNDSNITLLLEREKLKKKENTKEQEDEKNYTNKKGSTQKVFKSKTLNVSENQNPKSNNKEDKVKCKSKLNEVLWDDDQSVTSRRRPVKELIYNDEQNDNTDSENEGTIKSSEVLSVSGESAKLSMRNNIISKKGQGNQRDFSYVDALIHSERSFRAVDEKNNYEIPGIISTDTYTCHRSMESLNEISSGACSAIKPKIVLAQHIVVANVHKDFGIHFILHLFESYDPIAVSLMKTTHQTGIRYCHVYFKNPQDALEIETAFDKFAIYGERLIVLRNHRLLDEIGME